VHCPSMDFSVRVNYYNYGITVYRPRSVGILVVVFLVGAGSFFSEMACPILFKFGSMTYFQKLVRHFFYDLDPKVIGQN